MSAEGALEGDRFRPVLPRELFDYSAPPQSWRYDIAPDGTRVLSYKDLMSGASNRREPVVVINWFDELESMVPEAR